MVGCWAELRGDWKFLWQTLHLKQYYGTNYICHLCRAHKCISRLRFTNFARTARHRNTLVDSDLWQRWYSGSDNASPLLLVPGFCVWHVLFDVMHVLDLGVYQTVVPSAMWELTEPGAGIWAGGNRQARFDNAYLDYRRWCKDKKVKAVIRKRFAVSQWRKTASSYPRITQNVAKAAALRSMVYWVHEVCAEHAKAAGDHGRLRATMFAAFVRADLVCREAGRHLTHAQRQALGDNIEAALVCNNALAAAALKANKRLWKLVPKHHALSHIGFDYGINPRSTHCYRDEDMVGRCKRVYVRCHGKSAPRTALLRYCIMVCVRWWEEQRVLMDLPA